MPYNRPTLTQLISQAQTNVASHLPGDDPLLAMCPENAIAYALAGLTHGLHGHVMWLSKQLVPGPNMDYPWLCRWASIRGLTPTPATKTDLSATIAGASGTVVNAGVSWATNDGTTYLQDATATIGAGGTASINALAATAGAAGNQATGALLTLATPVVGVNSFATVSGINTVGADIEGTGAFLARYRLNLSTPAKGGGPNDYATWALAYSGVTRAWEMPLVDGPGTVGVYVVDDNASSGTWPALAANVQTYLRTLAPVTAVVNAYAPTPVAFNVTIGPTGAIPSAKQAAVTAEISGMVLALSAPTGCSIYLEDISFAVQTASGIDSFTIISPTGTTSYATPNMPVMGAVTYR